MHKPSFTAGNVIEAILIFFLNAIVLWIVWQMGGEGWGILVVAACLTTAYLIWKNYQITARFEQVCPKDSIVINSTSARLELVEPDGRKARYSKTKEIMALSGEVGGFTEGGIWAEGQLDNFTFSDNIGFKRRALPNRPHNYELDITLDEVLRKNQTVELSMGWDMIDCFLSDTEFFTISMSYPSKLYTFRITFPESRPVKTAWVEFTYMGRKTTITDKNLHIFDNRREVLFTMNQVFPGMKAIIMWEW